MLLLGLLRLPLCQLSALMNASSSKRQASTPRRKEPVEWLLATTSQPLPTPSESFNLVTRPVAALILVFCFCCCFRSLFLDHKPVPPNSAASVFRVLHKTPSHSISPTQDPTGSRDPPVLKTSFYPKTFLTQDSNSVPSFSGSSSKNILLLRTLLS